MAEEVRIVLRVDHRIDNPERDCLAVLGSAHELGCWKHEKAVKAEYMGRSTWQAVVKLPANQTCVWKWVVLNRATDEILQWESGVDKTLEINERPLMGVSEWGKPVVMTDISTESSTRIFEGVKDIFCENIHENNKPLETPRPRKKAVEKRGRVTGKKVKRVNSKGKLVEESAVKVRPKQPQKSLTTVAKLASINDLTAFANTCHSNPVKTTLSNSNFINEESTVKLKGGKGLKGLFQSLLRTQSQKRRSQGTCSDINRPVKADAGEAAVLTTERIEVTKDIPDFNAVATNAASLDSRARDEGGTVDKTLTSNTAISSQESSKAAGNTKVSTTKTQYEDMQMGNLGPTGEYKNTIGANSAILTPELTDDITGRPGFSDCDMILPTYAKLSTVTHNDMDVPNTDTNAVLLSQTNQTVESEPKFKTKTNANAAELEIAVPVITTVSTKNCSIKNGTGHVKANILAYEEMETKRAKNVIRPCLPSSVHQRSNLEENRTDDIHANGASNILNSSPDNTTTLIEMYMFKDYGLRSSVSDQSLHIEKKEIDTINSKRKLAVAKDAPIFSQSVESVVNDKSSAVQEKNLGFKTTGKTTCLNVNHEECKSLSNTVGSSGNEIPTQLTFEGLKQSENRKLGTYLHSNTDVGATKLDANDKVLSDDTVYKIRRDGEIKNNTAQKEWHKPGPEATTCVDKFITPVIDADKDTKKESQPSPKSFVPWSDGETRYHKDEVFKREVDIKAEEDLSRHNNHSLHKVSATVCDLERESIESADSCAYYEGKVSSKMDTPISLPHQFKYLNNSEEEDKQKALKGILRRYNSYKESSYKNECSEPEYYPDILNFQEGQTFSSDRFAKKYTDDDTTILATTLDEGSKYPTYKRNTSANGGLESTEVKRCYKEDDNRHLNSYHDNNSKGVTSKCLDDEKNGLTMEQCQDLKVVTRHLQEFSKDKEMDNTPDFLNQTESPRDLSNSKSFTGKKHSLEKHTINNHTHDSGIFVNDVVDAFPHQLFNDKGTYGADINSPIGDKVATYNMSEFENIEPDKVVPLKQENLCTNGEQQSYRNSNDDPITFRQQQFNEKDEYTTDIFSQSENEVTIFKESNNLILDGRGLIQQERDLYDAEQHSHRYRNDITDALQQDFYNKSEGNDAAITASPTENKLTTLKSSESLTWDNAALIQQERDFNYEQQYYRNGNDVKDTLQQNCFIEKGRNDAVTKSPIEKETTASKGRKRLTLDNYAPIDEDHFSTGEEEQFYRFQTRSTSVHCPDKGGVCIPSGRPASENESLKESELPDMAHHPIESISDFAYGEPCRSADESACENETLKEYEFPDMVTYPIESVSDFVCMHKLSDAIEKERVTTSKSSTTWEYATPSDIHWNNLSEYADIDTKILNSSYEKNIDIVEDDSNPTGDLLDENVMPERDKRGNEETPRVNFSRDIKRGDFQHVAKVQSVSCMTDETGMADGKDKLLDLVEKYKVPIGMSVAAACAAIFIMKKN